MLAIARIGTISGNWRWPASRRRYKSLGPTSMSRLLKQSASAKSSLRR